MARSRRPHEPGREGCTLKWRSTHTCGCQQCKFGIHCGRHSEGCHQACHGPRPGLGFRRFECYRPREHDRPTLGGIPAGRPRFEGVVFSDGTCVIRWTGDIRSTSVFSSFGAMMRAHGHPEYGTVIRWLDESPDDEHAGVAQLAERDPPKVEVTGSDPVVRSRDDAAIP
jgi:hypothetical protein